MGSLGSVAPGVLPSPAYQEVTPAKPHSTPSAIWVPMGTWTPQPYWGGGTFPMCSAGGFWNSARQGLWVVLGPWILTTLGLGSGSNTICLKTSGFWL